VERCWGNPLRLARMGRNGPHPLRTNRRKLLPSGNFRSGMGLDSGCGGSVDLESLGHFAARL